MILFFDTETTGLPEKGKDWENDFKEFPNIVQLSWIVTDDLGEILSSEDCIIQPVGWDIPEEAEKIHGISTQKALDTGIEYSVALKAFLYDAGRCEIIVGHNIYFDTSIIKANCLKLEFNKESISDILHKDKRFNTMQKTMHLFEPKKWGKLSEVYKKMFNTDLKDAHNALADVKAVKDIYFKLIADEPDSPVKE